MRPHLLQHLLARSARIHPGNPAVIFRDETITYAELERQSSAVAAALARCGVGAGDRVGILLTKGIEGVVALFGILKVGAVYVPIDPVLPAERIAYIVRNCDIGCVVSTPRFLEPLHQVLPELPLRTAILAAAESSPFDEAALRCLSWAEILAEEPAATCAAAIADTSPAYILHTSGSTGVPKGVTISHLNAMAFVSMAADVFEVRAGDRLGSQAPLHFDLSVFDIFVAVRCGAAIVVVPELFSTFPIELARYIADQRITIWNSVASVLTLLADKGRLQERCLDAMRIVHFSGDVMPLKYLKILQKHMRNASFFNIYGQTEANSSLCFPVPATLPESLARLPIGRALPNFEVFALDDSGRTIGPGEEGELYVAGSTVALGYWNEPRLTAEKFVPDPRWPGCRRIVYRTGDLVRLNQEGDYLFSGRKDHLVKSRGYRVELEEIEAVLGRHPGVAKAVAIPVPDEVVGNRIRAVIVTAQDAAASEEELMRYCKEHLPRYMVPEMLEYRDTLPMTSSGKVDRKGLLAGAAG